MKQLRETVTDIQTSIGHRIFDIAATYVVVLMFKWKFTATRRNYAKQRTGFT
jgi:hypothetical protein